MKNRYLCNLKVSKTGYVLLVTTGERLSDLESAKLKSVTKMRGGAKV